MSSDSYLQFFTKTNMTIGRQQIGSSFCSRKQTCSKFRKSHEVIRVQLFPAKKSYPCSSSHLITLHASQNYSRTDFNVIISGSIGIKLCYVCKLVLDLSAICKLTQTISWTAFSKNLDRINIRCIFHSISAQSPFRKCTT